MALDINNIMLFRIAFAPAESREREGDEEFLPALIPHALLCRRLGKLLTSLASLYYKRTRSSETGIVVFFFYCHFYFVVAPYSRVSYIFGFCCVEFLPRLWIFLYISICVTTPPFHLETVSLSIRSFIFAVRPNVRNHLEFKTKGKRNEQQCQKGHKKRGERGHNRR